MHTTRQCLAREASDILHSEIRGAPKREDEGTPCETEARNVGRERVPRMTEWGTKEGDPTGREAERE